MNPLRRFAVFLLPLLLACTAPVMAQGESSAAAAKALHLLLYAMLIAQPLLGLFTAWTDGKEIFIPFTSVALPALMAESESLAHQFEDIHKLVGDAFYWVVGLHVLAALYHHFLRRDDTLRRMT